MYASTHMRASDGLVARTSDFQDSKDKRCMLMMALLNIKFV
jgi:hypothetical protein